MSAESLINEAALEARMREIARQEAARPALVHQRNVEAVVGMPGGDFLGHGRDGGFLTWKVRRLVFAKTSDVIAFIEAHPARQRAANDVGDRSEATALARVGARRVSA